MTREELLRSSEYWTTKMQLELYARIEAYMSENKINRTELAKRLGVSKGYVTQILNGDYDHRLSKLVEIALKIDYVPRIIYEPFVNVIGNNGSYYDKLEVKYCACRVKQFNNDDFVNDGSLTISRSYTTTDINSFRDSSYAIKGAS